MTIRRSRACATKSATISNTSSASPCSKTSASCCAPFRWSSSSAARGEPLRPATRPKRRSRGSHPRGVVAAPTLVRDVTWRRVQIQIPRLAYRARCGDLLRDLARGQCGVVELEAAHDAVVDLFPGVPRVVTDHDRRIRGGGVQRTVPVYLVRCVGPIPVIRMMGA